MTRAVDDLVKALGMSGVSKSQVSRLCAEIDERVTAFLERPLEGDWPYLWIDVTYLEVRQNGRIVSVAVIVAVGVNTDGRREVLGMDIGPSEASCWHSPATPRQGTRPSASRTSAGRRRKAGGSLWCGIPSPSGCEPNSSRSRRR